jgi:hypothetical protein
MQFQIPFPYHNVISHVTSPCDITHARVTSHVTSHATVTSPWGYHIVWGMMSYILSVWTWMQCAAPSNVKLVK